MAIRYSQKTFNNSEVLRDQIKRGVQANLKAAAIIWHAGIIRELRGPRSGYEYAVPGTGRVVNAEKEINGRTFYFRKLEGAKMYTASAPGEAPATVTGDLRTSYRFRVSDDHMAEVGSPLDYALFLEKGTVNMAPRPHIKPAYAKNAKKIKEALERNVI